MKYVGSKARIAKHIVPILQQMLDSGSYDAYVEPFVGGANIIQHIKHPVRIGADYSIPLIRLLQHVAYGGDLPKTVDRATYDAIRDGTALDYDDLTTGIYGYLASYNGKYFGGFAGVVTTKDGTVKDYYDEARRNLLKQAKDLRDVALLVGNYKTMKIASKALVYCDPPYSGTTGYSKRYSFDSREFWDTVRRWQAEGNTVVVSEQQAPDDFKCIWEMPVIRTLNHGGRQIATEKLFIHK